MRWTPGGSSSDIEDRRGGGGGGGFGFGRGPTIGCGGAIILLVLSLLTGKNFFTFFDGSGGGAVQQAPAGQQQPPAQESAEEKQAREFVTFVLNDTQDTWTKVMEGEGVPYRRAKLVLFRDGVQSGCGNASSQAGPFYCPSDEKVYIDLAFYDELRQRFGAPGDFAQAYVIAHEIGHHVQNILGIAPRVHDAMERNPRQANDLSVRMELQADCFAGVWGHSTDQRKILESGDVEEGLNAAAAIGDDRLQQQAGRNVNPESFTHGSSAQRQEWFQRGFQSGRIADCDTFQ
jgi:predicted metalloprotease